MFTDTHALFFIKKFVTSSCGPDNQHFNCEQKKKSVRNFRTFTLKSLSSTVVPTKSDSDVKLCLQLLSKTLTCTLHLSIRKSIDHLSINPILWIGLVHK